MYLSTWSTVLDPNPGMYVVHTFLQNHPVDTLLMTCKLDILDNDVLKYKNRHIGRIVILGDLNCRTGIENDFIESHFSNSFVIPPELDGIYIDDIVSEHIHRQRNSDD